jgi:hypothetical protein
MKPYIPWLKHRGLTALNYKLIDEAEASIEASFFSALSMGDRTDLVEDSRDQLTHWLSMVRTPGESHEN